MNNWLNNFKVAVVNQDFMKIDELFDTYPNFDDLQEMQQAAVLIAEALRLLKIERANVANNMKKLEISRNYLTESFA